jgi:hypothetical protein
MLAQVKIRAPASGLVDVANGDSAIRQHGNRDAVGEIF